VWLLLKEKGKEIEKGVGRRKGGRERGERERKRERSMQMEELGETVLHPRTKATSMLPGKLCPGHFPLGVCDKDSLQGATSRAGKCHLPSLGTLQPAG
jgi:hypothetical protein